MRLILDNREGTVHVHKFFPQGGAIPAFIQVEPGELVLIDVTPGEVTELQREARS